MAKLILILLLLLNCNNNIDSDESINEMANIEIISQNGDRAPYFVVDNTVNYVNLNLPTSIGYLENSDTKQILTKGDNFEVLSFGLTLPMCFDLYESQNGNDLIQDNINLFYDIDPYASPEIFKHLFIIWANYEMNLGEFFDFAKGFTKDFKIGVGITSNIKVSMIGVPDKLQGLRFHAPIFLKIRHTIDLK